jgi:hypothetical protein
MTARVRDGLALARRDGVRSAAQRAVRYAYRRYATSLEFPLHARDVADVAPVTAPVGPRPAVGTPLHVVWVCVPPALGSGGHTTMFRMVRALEEAGHRCTVLLYDRWAGDVERQAAVIRAGWPAVRAAVLPVRDALPPADAVIATSWETAHVVAVRPGTPGRRFYFVQDFEPAFYGHGAEHALAEATYSFGFHGITAGDWLAERLAADYGMPCDAFPFGTDLDVYRVTNPEPRRGLVFYTKPGVPRRGHALGVLALERFARERPDCPIHLFGDPVGALPFPATVHGTLSTGALNELYNSCTVGLSLSFTNVSLLPWELIASGVVPVVNDAPQNRRVLRHRGVRWTRPTPGALASALCSVVDGQRPAPRELAGSDTLDTWECSGRVVVRALESALYEPATDAALAEADVG